MPKRIPAVLLISGCSGTLLYSQLNPFVVQLQSSRANAPDSSFPMDGITLRFSEEQEFKCSKNRDIQLINESNSNSGFLQSLIGICWTSERDTVSRVTWKVCPGDVVYTVPDGKNVKLQLIASSVKMLELRGVGDLNHFSSERFISGNHAFFVRYECSHILNGVHDVDMLDGSHVRSIVVRSFVFCDDTTNTEFRKLISDIPPLNIFVDEPGNPAFWEYKFQYPGYAAQQHTDVTGKTRDEFYVLGSTPSSDLSLIQYTDTDLDEGDPYISSFLQFPLAHGDVCEKYNISRAVDISYVCPLEWHDLEGVTTRGWSPYNVSDIPEKTFLARIRQVEEVRLCQYELVVDATSLCVLKQFRQRYLRMDIKNSIRCYPN